MVMESGRPLNRRLDKHYQMDGDVCAVLGMVRHERHLYLTLCSYISWKSIVVVKVLMGMNLLSYANRRRAGMEARAAADVVNDFGRDPIGEGKEERVSSSDAPCGDGVLTASSLFSGIQPRAENAARQQAGRCLVGCRNWRA